MRALLPFAVFSAASVVMAMPAAAKSTANAVTDPSLAKILANPRRSEDHDRDRWRHPAQTLSFFRIRPGQTVVDYTPAGGWWTRILVPYLGEAGRYIALNPDVRNSPDMARNYADAATVFPPHAAQWTSVPPSRILAYNTDSLPTDLNGKVDRVLVFRAVHNLFRRGMLTRELSAIRDLLKPDGLLGIEQHRAKPNAPAAYTDGSKGYLREKDVIALVEAHGFALVSRSEINANPRDTADYPAGVWTLPPSLVIKENKARYEAIGESDRMTLLFRKRA